MNELLNELVLLIREKRKEQHLSLEALSQATGLSKSELWMIEKRRRGMSLKTYLLIEEALGYSPGELLFLSSIKGESNLGEIMEELNLHVDKPYVYLLLKALLGLLKK